MTHNRRAMWIWLTLCIYIHNLLIKKCFFFFCLCLTCFPKWRFMLDRVKWDKHSSKAFQKHPQLTAPQLRIHILLQIHRSRDKGKKPDHPDIISKASFKWNYLTVYEKHHAEKLCSYRCFYNILLFEGHIWHFFLDKDIRGVIKWACVALALPECPFAAPGSH